MVSLRLLSSSEEVSLRLQSSSEEDILSIIQRIYEFTQLLLFDYYYSITSANIKKISQVKLNITEKVVRV
jgi:hypothetical protein